MSDIGVASFDRCHISYLLQKERKFTHEQCVFVAESNTLINIARYTGHIYLLSVGVRSVFNKKQH